ncbi:MAG: peptidase M48, partial [Cyanobacteria bacterium J06650_10]
KLSGGSPTLSPQLNLDAFIDQANSYDAISESEIGEMLKRMKTDELSHPVPVLRAREISRWATTPTYQSLLENRPLDRSPDSDTQPQAKSSAGNWLNW